jgi:hypothetical protein
MVKSPILEVPRGNPRVIHVTTELLDLLDLSDLKFRSLDGPEYGKLEVRYSLPTFYTSYVYYSCQQDVQLADSPFLKLLPVELC